MYGVEYIDWSENILSLVWVNAFSIRFGMSHCNCVRALKYVKQRKSTFMHRQAKSKIAKIAMKGVLKFKVHFEKL